ASISSVSGTGSVYDIKVNVTGIGTLGLDLNASGTGITDEAGNAISGGFTEGETYDIVVSTQPNASLVHGPYLQMTSQTAVTVRWRTDVATDSKVDVGTAFSNYTITETDGKDTTNHEVRVTGLKADTKYYYRFGSSTQVLQAGQDNYFTTAPPVTTKRKIRVAAFGDCGSISSTVQQAVLKAYLNYTASNPAELMLLLGDNAYEDGTDSEYSSNFFKRYDGSILKNHNLFPVPGNHDYHLVPLTSRTSPYFNNFSLPTAGECGGVPSGSESYYSYNWGNIHFIALDSYGEESDNTHLYDTLGPQMTWLKKDLAANTNRWTIAYWHHPPFSKGTHNSDTESDLTKIRQKVIRILERYGVDIILCGHSHVYERSYLLRGYYGTEAEFDLTTDAVSSSSAKYDGSSNSCLYTTADGQVDHGTVYVVAGSASRSGSAVESTFPHDALPFATNDGGMFYFEVEDNRLDGKMIDMDGTVFDQFTIMKGVNNTTTQSVTAGSSATLTASWIGNYKWSTGATTRSITVTPSGDQTYTVTDDNSCLRDQFNVNVVTTLAAASPNVNIKSINNTSGLVSVYPTLVQKGRLISIRSNPMEVSDASMVDNNGRLVRRFKLAGSADLETGNLAAGSYFIIINNKNKISRYRVVVAE
ncbi:MAG TPA: metallophosphoesterase, partial [Flavisolibacter sp.]|nr:metallophosphoesterase [Flavisolibacter sp.]